MSQRNPGWESNLGPVQRKLNNRVAITVGPDLVNNTSPKLFLTFCSNYNTEQTEKCANTSTVE